MSPPSSCFVWILVIGMCLLMLCQWVDYMYPIQEQSPPIEGMTSTDTSTNTNTSTNDPAPSSTSYGSNSCSVLENINAANIQVMQNQIANFTNNNNNNQQTIAAMQSNITSLQTQVNGLVTQQQQAAQQIANTTTPTTITGAGTT